MYVYFMENTTHSFGRHFVSVVAARVEASGISHSEFGRRVFGASDGGRTWRAVRDPKGSGKPRVLLLDEAYTMARALDMDRVSVISTGGERAKKGELISYLYIAF